MLCANTLSEQQALVWWCETVIQQSLHARYRVQKFIQRNRRLAFGAASITCALLVGAVVSTGFAFYAKWQLDRAVATESRLQGSLNDAQQERKKAVDEATELSKPKLYSQN